MIYNSEVIIVLCVCIVLFLWVYFSQNIQWWNDCIKTECNEQDSFSLTGIPTYNNAWNCKQNCIKDLHGLISVYHNQILNEVNAITQPTDSIWVRFMGEWTDTSSDLPTLKQIASIFPQIVNIRVGIFQPGTTLIENKSISRITRKYHYGLKVSRNDVGLRIGGSDVKWEEREGFYWDDTIAHSMWNHTSEPRIIIFVDILRELSWLNSWVSSMIYSLMKRDSEIMRKKAELQYITNNVVYPQVSY